MNYHKLHERLLLSDSLYKPWRNRETFIADMVRCDYPDNKFLRRKNSAKGFVPSNIVGLNCTKFFETLHEENFALVAKNRQLASMVVGYQTRLKILAGIAERE